MILTILLSILLIVSPMAAQARHLHLGDEAPDFRLMILEGEFSTLEDYKDEILVFIYWKPTQKRSIMALKDAQKLSEAYSKKGVRFLGITADIDKKEEIINILEEGKINFPILFDSQRKVYGSYEIRVYPTTVIIDKAGKLSNFLPGHPLTYLTALEGYIRLSLGEIDKETLIKSLSPVKEEVDASAREAERRYHLALTFADLQLWDQAIESAKKSIESKPDIAKYHILFGFLMLENKDTDMALASFNKAIELKPDSKDAKTGLGKVYILNNELDKAIEILTSAATLNPYAQMAYFELGMAYELKGEKDKSIEMYKKSVQKIFKKRILPSSISKCK